MEVRLLTFFLAFCSGVSKDGALSISTIEGFPILTGLERSDSGSNQYSPLSLSGLCSSTEALTISRLLDVLALPFRTRVMAPVLEVLRMVLEELDPGPNGLLRRGDTRVASLRSLFRLESAPVRGAEYCLRDEKGFGFLG